MNGYFFFFQAEDGIRDFHVTGVQTCALPISRSVRAQLESRWPSGSASHSVRTWSRSEERRVGKECRSRWSPYHSKKKRKAARLAWASRAASAAAPHAAAAGWPRRCRPKSRSSRARATVWRWAFFFFQAEDGIRDFHVTGVQTCALPISVSTTNGVSRYPSSALSRLHA